MSRQCLQSRGGVASAAGAWALAPANPAHNRYAKMLANNTASPLLRREHNCLIGNERDSLALWEARQHRTTATNSGTSSSRFV